MNICTDPYGHYSSLFVWHTVHMTGIDDNDAILQVNHLFEGSKHAAQAWTTV